MEKKIYSICILKDGDLVIYVNQFLDEDKAKSDFRKMMRKTFGSIDDFDVDKASELGHYSALKENQVTHKFYRYSIFYNEVNLVQKIFYKITNK